MWAKRGYWTWRFCISKAVFFIGALQMLILHAAELQIRLNGATLYP